MTNNKKFIKSPLNYTGGKYKLLKQIIPLFPKNIDTFYDIFSGGGNVGINVEANKVVFVDYNNYLMELFQYFQVNNMEDIISKVETRITEYDLTKENREGYLRLRDDFNKNRNIIDFYVLICFSFNHMPRFNNNQQFNTPFGKNRSYFSESLKLKLITFINAIHSNDVSFNVSDFEIDLSQLKSNDFIYCDPPYLITTAGYNDGKRGFGGWNEIQEYRLLNFLDSASQRNIKFALSNVLEHHGITNDILIEWAKNNNYKIHSINSSYSNSSYNKKNRSPSIEVLITNY